MKDALKIFALLLYTQHLHADANTGVVSLQSAAVFSTKTRTTFPDFLTA